MKNLVQLDRYHKQAWDKIKLKELEGLNKDFKLDLNCKDTYDLLRLQVFQESLKNKKAFENEFNKFHQIHLDMWENMTFNERNFFIQKDMNELKQGLKNFEFNDKTIHMAFFNELLNVLYDEQTAILDLPQYFKFYDEFDKELIPIKTYGLKPLLANMAWPKAIAQKGNTVILFDAKIQTLFKVNQEICERYPLYEKSEINHPLIIDLAKLLLKEEYLSFYAALEANNLMSPRLEKKFKRVLKRSAK